MPEMNPGTWWRSFLNLPNDSRTKTLTVAFLVALVCATAVSFTAVALKPLQDANLERQRQARMEEMIAALPGMADILREAGADSLETHIVNLDRGTFLVDVDPAGFDFHAAARDQNLSIALDRDVDVAGIGRRPNLAPVHLLRSGTKLVLVVLPVYGTGYQSTIRAYLALEGDLKTIAALSIYEQGETPGVGSRITDTAWQALWPGRQIADEDGVIRISVVRGNATNLFEVDGISGATRSTTGVTNILHFWLGAHGFGPFLARLATGDI